MTQTKRRATGSPKLNSIAPSLIDWTCDECGHIGSDSVTMLFHARKYRHNAFTRRD